MSERPGDDRGTEPEGRYSSETKMFAIIAALTMVIFVIYLATAEERAGQVLLGLTSVFSFIMAVFLAARDRRGVHDVEEEPTPAGNEPPPQWFPESSMWPFTLAAGIALVLAGLALGLWVLFPGLFLLAQGLWSFTMESRRRGARRG